MPSVPYRLRPVDDWRHPFRFVSLHLSGGLALVFGLGPIIAQTWREIPDEWKSMLPNGWAHWIATAGFVLIAASHFLQLQSVVQADPHAQGEGDDQ